MAEGLDPPRWRIQPLGEAAVLVEAADVAPQASHYIAALDDELARRPLPGQLATVHGISSLLVRFDPLALAVDEAARQLQAQMAALQPRQRERARIVTVPVRYGGTAGPDLDDVAALLGLTPAAVVAEHCRHTYAVIMLGFAPGFPYIGPVSAQLTIARRATPRAAVPAGSVALAAGLTGIYPARLPGGWHLIGRTELRLFDPEREPPTLLEAGDGVRFEPLPEGVVP